MSMKMKLIHTNIHIKKKKSLSNTEMKRKKWTYIMAMETCLRSVSKLRKLESDWAQKIIASHELSLYCQKKKKNKNHKHKNFKSMHRLRSTLKGSGESRGPWTWRRRCRRWRRWSRSNRRGDLEGSPSEPRMASPPTAYVDRLPSLSSRAMTSQIRFVSISSLSCSVWKCGSVATSCASAQLTSM